MRFKTSNFLAATVSAVLLASCSANDSGDASSSGGSAASSSQSAPRNENGWEFVSTASAMDGNSIVAQKEFSLNQAIVEVFVECRANKFLIRAQTFSPDGTAMPVLQTVNPFLNKVIPIGRAKVGEKSPVDISLFFATTNYDNVIELTNGSMSVGLYSSAFDDLKDVNWVRILKDNLPLVVEVNAHAATVEFVVDASAPVLRVIDECGGNRPPYDGAAEGSSLPAAQAVHDAPAEQSASNPQSPSAATSAGENFVPVEVMEGPDPVYPWSLQGSGIAGTVVVEVEVDDTGRTTAVRVKRSSGNADLDEAAVVGVERWSFEPAQQNGGPVRSSSEYEITFDAE